MKAFWARFKGMGRWEQVLTATGLITSAAIILLAALYLLGLFDGAAWLYIPMTGVNLLSQGLRLWKTSRSTSVISFVCAGAVWVCFVLMFIL